MSFIPNTTPTPNWLYNGEMRKMSGTELKIVLLVTRKTLGWFDPMTDKRKSQDYISQSQFMEFTGFSNRAIATAIQACVEGGWIIARDKKGNLCDTAEKRERRRVWYQLGSIFINKISGEESSSEDKSGELISKSGEQNDINLVKKVHSTKETITKETIQNTILKDTKQNFGNGDINFLISYFKENLKLPLLDGSEKENRRYCWLAIKKFGGREGVENLIKLTAAHDFWKSKITSFKDLYYRGVRIVSETRGGVADVQAKYAKMGE